MTDGAPIGDQWLADRVCVVTGGGRGLGREHALLFGRLGACVVVNDLHDESKPSAEQPASNVVDEIVLAGGRATTHFGDITTSEGADALLQSTVAEFGDPHVLVNNAGILRDRMLINMSDAEFDDVVHVHLRGHFAPTRAFANHWRTAAKQDPRIDRSVINTASGAGLYGNLGQTNYAAAKAGIAAMSQVWSKELARYGVRVNSICPVARTGLTSALPAVSMASGDFDYFDPANVSPLVAYLAGSACPYSGHMFAVQGDQVVLMQGWGGRHIINRGSRWSVDAVAQAFDAWAHEDPVGEWKALRDYEAILSS